MNTLLQELNDALVALLADRGADHRTIYTHAVALPPDGSVVELETSDAALGADLKARLDLSGGDAGSLRITALPAAGLPELLIPVTSVADVRRFPSHASELVSQAVCGDALRPLKAEGEWFLVRMDDGYLGWVRSWHVAARTAAAQQDFDLRAAHRLTANWASVLTAPERGALPLGDLVVGTPLRVLPEARRGWLQVELPDGREGFLRSADVGRRPPRGRRMNRQRLSATGLRFLGIPYLWGGTTPRGFDCSGLVQRIYRLHGRVLPRDSDQQARFGKEKTGIARAGWNPGDLLFFGSSSDRITHVGMVLPGGDFLHAYGQVTVNSLDPSSPRFLPDLARIWRSCRDPLATE